MKISLWPNKIKNASLFKIGSVLFVLVIIGLFVGMVCDVHTDSKIHALFPEGTEVIVKGTDIHGTVLRWCGQNVVIGYAEKDGTVKTVVYNYNLLKKQ